MEYLNDLEKRIEKLEEALIEKELLLEKFEEDEKWYYKIGVKIFYNFIDEKENYEIILKNKEEVLSYLKLLLDERKQYDYDKEGNKSFREMAEKFDTINCKKLLVCITRKLSFKYLYNDSKRSFVAGKPLYENISFTSFEFWKDECKIIERNRNTEFEWIEDLVKKYE